MTTWLFVAIVAYFIAALNSVIDKYLLNKSIPQPLVYAFYVGLFSIFTVIITPFGFGWPGLFQFFAAISVGIVFLFALISFFTALKKDEASRVVSLVGALTPGFILLFSMILFGETLVRQEWFALGFLILGGIVVSSQRTQKCSIFALHKYECLSSTVFVILASVFFALFFVFAKFVFSNQEFVSGFVWTRIGSFLGALALLAIPFAGGHIFMTTKTVQTKTGALFVTNKALAGVSFFLLNYAISLGNVTLVNALEGTKYAFVFLFVLLLSVYKPQLLSEDIRFTSILQKFVAIILIAAGIFIISIF